MYPTIYKVRNMTQKAFCDLSGFLFTAGLHGEICGERFIVRQDDLPKLTGKMLMLYIKLFERYGMFMEKDDGKLSFLFPDCQDVFTAWRLLAIKRQIVQFCKPCNGFMGCTKGGKNKQFSVTVHLENGEHRLCLEFVQMEWYNGDISTEKIDFMLELNELQERFGKNWKK